MPDTFGSGTGAAWSSLKTLCVPEFCSSMTIGDGFKARLEFVLEQALENLSHGGDHATRAFVAARLLNAAQAGTVKLDDLKRVAQDALLDAIQPPKPA